MPEPLSLKTLIPLFFFFFFFVYSLSMCTVFLLLLLLLLYVRLNIAQRSCCVIIALSGCVCVFPFSSGTAPPPPPPTHIDRSGLLLLLVAHYQQGRRRRRQIGSDDLMRMIDHTHFISVGLFSIFSLRPSNPFLKIALWWIGVTAFVISCCC